MKVPEDTPGCVVTPGRMFVASEYGQLQSIMQSYLKALQDVAHGSGDRKRLRDLKIGSYRAQAVPPPHVAPQCQRALVRPYLSDRYTVGRPVCQSVKRASESQGNEKL